MAILHITRYALNVECHVTFVLTDYDLLDLKTQSYPVNTH